MCRCCEIRIQIKFLPHRLVFARDLPNEELNFAGASSLSMWPQSSNMYGFAKGAAASRCCA
jgi:hypothetical protein